MWVNGYPLTEVSVADEETGPWLSFCVGRG